MSQPSHPMNVLGSIKGFSTGACKTLALGPAKIQPPLGHYTWGLNRTWHHPRVSQSTNIKCLLEQASPKMGWEWGDGGFSKGHLTCSETRKIRSQFQAANDLAEGLKRHQADTDKDCWTRKALCKRREFWGPWGLSWFIHLWNVCWTPTTCNTLGWYWGWRGEPDRPGPCPWAACIWVGKIGIKQLITSLILNYNCEC